MVVTIWCETDALATVNSATCATIVVAQAGIILAVMPIRPNDGKKSCGPIKNAAVYAG